MLSLCTHLGGRNALGIAAAPRIIVILLQRHESTPALVTLCRLVAGLSQDSPENVQRMVQSGVCKAVAVVMEKHIQSITQAKLKLSKRQAAGRKIRRSIHAVNSGVSDIATATVKAAKNTASVVTASMGRNSPVAVGEVAAQVVANGSPVTGHRSPSPVEDSGGNSSQRAVSSDSTGSTSSMEKKSLGKPNSPENTTCDGVALPSSTSHPKVGSSEHTTGSSDLRGGDIELIESCCAAVLALVKYSDDVEDTRMKFNSGTDIRVVCTTIVTSIIPDGTNPTHIEVKNVLKAIQPVM